MDVTAHDNDAHLERKDARNCDLRDCIYLIMNL